MFEGLEGFHHLASCDEVRTEAGWVASIDRASQIILGRAKTLEGAFANLNTLRRIEGTVHGDCFLARQDDVVG
jgi:hypothetical protein